MKILTIVVTFNGAKWIDKCFKSLIESKIKTDIIVIDNFSSDGTPDLIQEKYPTVNIYKSNINLGFGKANNIGLKKIIDDDYDFAFLLNQDAWIEENTIQHLIKNYQNNQNYGIVAPLQLNGEGTLIDKLFLEYTIGTCRELLTDLLLNNNVKDIYKTQFANAACWLIHKSTIKKVGGFDPLFPHYGEDDDFINRLFYHNLLVGICPNSKVYHDREHRVEEKDILKRYNHAYIRILSNHKNHNTPDYKRTYYHKQFLLNYIQSLFGNNKLHYKIKCKAIRRFFKTYNKANENMENEKLKKFLYL